MVQDAKTYAITAAELLDTGHEVHDHYKDTVTSIVLNDDTFTYYFCRIDGSIGQSTLRYNSCIYDASSWLSKWKVYPSSCFIKELSKEGGK